MKRVIKNLYTLKGGNAGVEIAELRTLLGLGTTSNSTEFVEHVLATAANDFLVASGSGVFVKKTVAETRTILLASGISIVTSVTNAISIGTGTFSVGVLLGGTLTTGIEIGACTTGISITGAATQAISITGTATDAIKILTGTYTNGINIAGTTTTGITIGTCTSAVAVTGTVTQAMNITAAANVTYVFKFNAVAGCVIANDVDPKDVPSTGGLGADGAIKVLINATPYYIPIFDGIV